MRLLDSLKGTVESDGTLLGKTSVLYGSNLGDAHKHTTDNLPILLAGGSFRHGQHLAFDRQSNAPLANVFVSILQDLGLEFEKFASSTGTINGLS